MTDREIMEALLAGKTVKNAKTGLRLSLGEDGRLKSRATEEREEDSAVASWIFNIHPQSDSPAFRYDRIAADD